MKKIMNLKSDGLYPSLLTESEIYNKSFNVLDSILKDFFPHSCAIWNMKMG